MDGLTLSKAKSDCHTRGGMVIDTITHIRSTTQSQTPQRPTAHKHHEWQVLGGIWWSSRTTKKRGEELYSHPICAIHYSAPEGRQAEQITQEERWRVKKERQTDRQTDKRLVGRFDSGWFHRHVGTDLMWQIRLTEEVPVRATQHAMTE